MKKVPVAAYAELEDRKPEYALVGEVDLVVVRIDDAVAVFYGRCLHRGALMSDGFVKDNNLVCGVHYWDYRLDTGVSEYANSEALPKFASWVEDGEVWVDQDEIALWAEHHPQPFQRDQYLGLYADTSHGTAEEPHTGMIQQYARDGLSKTGHHGTVESMGVPRDQLPSWDDIQLLTAQLWRAPLLDDHKVGTEVVIGPNAKKPLRLDIPLFVSDMSFGALSAPAKIALAMGAELAGTGICSGEGGMLPGEQAENSRYFYEMASARFGFSWEQLNRVQAFHFKGGQGAKTGTGGHLPGSKVRGEIAKVRGLKEGQDAISPSMQAIGCLGMRACQTNNCPVGIATQKPSLTGRLVVKKSAEQLKNFFLASTELMQVMARACGHDHLSKFCLSDLTTWKKSMSELSGVSFGGVS